GAFVGLRRTVGETGFEVAAEKEPRIAVQRGLQRCPYGTDDGDGTDAESEAGEENTEAPEVTPQVDHGHTQPGGELAHAGTASAVSRPWFMCSSRSARCARSGSWVMSRMA